MNQTKKNPYIIIGFVFVLLIFLGVGLNLNPRDVPSPLINQPAPEFSMPTLHDSTAQFNKADLLGQYSLVNVWATWCPTCYAEHEVLKAIAKQSDITIFGINWKDDPIKAKAWLEKLGNPYAKVGLDESGYRGIDFGVYGAPETYLIDNNGIILHKQTGAMTWQIWQQKFLPEIKKL